MKSARPKENGKSGASRPDSALALYRWVAPYFRSKRKEVSLVFFLSLAAIAISLLQPYLTKAIIDDGIANRDFMALLIAGAAMIAICVISPIIGYCTRRAYIRASADVLHKMREDLFYRILHFSPSTLSNIRHGDLLTRLEGDLAELQRFALDSLLSAINSSVLIIGTVVILGVMSPSLTMLVITVFLFNSKILTVLRPRLEQLSRDVRDIGANRTSFLIERISGVKHIQTFRAEQRELSSLQQFHKRIKDKTLELQTAGYIASALPNITISIGIVVIFVVGGWLIIDGQDMTLGMLVAFTTYAQRISGPMQSFSGLYVSWQKARVSLGRILELIKIKEQKINAQKHDTHLDAAASLVHPGDLKVTDLCFRYSESSPIVLNKLTLHIPGGQKVLIKAPSGYGKSTLIDILHGHEIATSGKISVGGRNLSTLTLDQIRKSIVVVSQEATIFSGTLVSNVRYSSPNTSNDELLSALHISGLGESLDKNRISLNTNLGSKGLTLSGGEKQRIALARAILLKPAILIIDEATSGLDIESERELLSKIARALPDSTLIVVSHRKFDPGSFDKIVDLRDYSKPGIDNGCIGIYEE